MTIFNESLHFVVTNTDKDIEEKKVYLEVLGSTQGKAKVIGSCFINLTKYILKHTTGDKLILKLQNCEDKNACINLELSVSENCKRGHQRAQSVMSKGRLRRREQLESKRTSLSYYKGNSKGCSNESSLRANNKLSVEIVKSADITLNNISITQSHPLVHKANNLYNESSTDQKSNTKEVTRDESKRDETNNLIENTGFEVNELKKSTEQLIEFNSNSNVKEYNGEESEVDIVNEVDIKNKNIKKYKKGNVNSISVQDIKVSENKKPTATEHKPEDRYSSSKPILDFFKNPIQGKKENEVQKKIKRLISEVNI